MRRDQLTLSRHYAIVMRGSRKFWSGGVQLGQRFFVCCFLVDEGREDPSTTIGGPLMAFHWRADDGPTLNAGLLSPLWIRA